MLLTSDNIRESVLNKKAGTICIVAGVAALFAALLCMFMVGTIAVPVLFILSVVLNSLGITLMRKK